MAKATAQIRRAPVHRFVDVSAGKVVPPDIPPAVDPPDPADAPDRSTPITALSATPLMPAMAVSRAVSLQVTTYEDIDQLWDWTRDDPQGVQSFLGLACKNSRELFTLIEKIVGQQQQGHAWFHSVREDGGALIGFVMLYPITRTEGHAPVGTAHIYLCPARQGQLQTLLTSILDEGDRLLPGMTFAVITTRDEWARILQSVGFERQIVLTRHSSMAGDTHGS